MFGSAYEVHIVTPLLLTVLVDKRKAWSAEERLAIQRQLQRTYSVVHCQVRAVVSLRMCSFLHSIDALRIRFVLFHTNVLVSFIPVVFIMQILVSLHVCSRNYTKSFCFQSKNLIVVIICLLDALLS